MRTKKYYQNLKILKISKLLKLKIMKSKEINTFFHKEKLNLEYDCSSMLAVLEKINLKKFKNICCILSGKKKIGLNKCQNYWFIIEQKEEFVIIKNLEVQLRL